jgi:hypothetical protein
MFVDQFSCCGTVFSSKCPHGFEFTKNRKNKQYHASIQAETLGATIFNNAKSNARVRIP